MPNAPALPETVVMSDGLSSSELEKAVDPKTVVMSNDASTCASGGTGVKSSELKKTDDPKTILTSDGAGYDVIIQSHAKSPLKVISVDNNSNVH